MLGLADVDRDVLARRGVADDLTGVDLLACVDDQGAALLGVEQAVGDGVAGIKADEGAGGAGLDVAAPFLVAVEDRVHDALAVGVGQELAAIAEQAAAGHTELDAGAAVHHLHVHQDGLAGAQSGHDVALIGLGHVDDNALHRLHDLAVLLVGQNVRGADLQLVTFAAHGLNQDGQVHFATAHYAEGIVGGGIFHTQGNVLQQLALQAVTDLAAGDVLAFLAGKRGIVDGEGHLNGRIVDLNKGQRLNLAGVAHGVADGNIGQTGKGNNITGSGLLNGLAAVCLKVKQLGDAAGHVQVGVVPVANLNSLANLDDTVLHAANAHAAHKVVVVHAGNQHLHRGFGFTLRRGNVLQDGIKQRLQVGAVFGVGPIIAGGAVTAGAEHHRAVQLLVGSAQVHQQVEDLVDDFLDAGIGTVDLVDGDNKAQILLQSLLQHETGLGHAALSSVHQQQNAVDHLQHALDLAAEVGVARGIDDIDLDTLVGAGAVLGQNGDAALTLDVTAVHDTLSHSLIVAESAALAQQGVHQRGLAVVNVSDDSDIAQIVTNHKIQPLYFESQ